MSHRQACVVWTRDFETGEWSTDGEERSEREAVHHARYLRCELGLVAKSLPLGAKPKPELVK
jgi:hypothetical protein